MPKSLSFSPDSAVTDTETSCRLSARFCAVTIISSSFLPDAVGASNKEEKENIRESIATDFFLV